MKKDDEIIEEIARHLRQSAGATKDWRLEAQRAYDFAAGNQYTQEDIQAAGNERPLIVFNRIGPVLDSVVGLEVANRHEIRFVPTERSDAKVSELLSTAVEWVMDRANGEIVINKVFRDVATCGLGMLAVNLNYDRDPDGEIVLTREDPLSVYWDINSSQPNATDRRWVALVKLVPVSEIADSWGEDLAEGIVVDTETWGEFLSDSLRPQNGDPRFAYQFDKAMRSPDDRVPVVEYQYLKKEPFYRVWLPTGQEEIDPKMFRDIKQELDAQGIRYVKQTRKIWYRAIVAGNTVLDHQKSPCPEHSTLHLMCGKRDDSVSGWYGLVRAMIGTQDVSGPQQLVNKLYSEAVHTVSTNSKGGLLAETDAFEDPRDAEAAWSSGDQIIWMRPGGLQRIQPKPLGDYPSSLDRLLQWATQAVPEVTGVNFELLGMVQRDQPGIVEDSRRQAAMTILAEYFDALRLLRSELGRCLAYMVSEYMAGDSPQDSRMIRIAGAGFEQVVPLVKDALVQKFDVVVDEAPTANQKERTWRVLMELMPMAMQMGMQPPPQWIEYAPLPATLIEAWTQSMAQAQQAQGQNPQAEIMQRMVEAEAAKAESAAQLNLAKTQESAAKAAQILQDTQMKPAELQIRNFGAPI